MTQRALTILIAAVLGIAAVTAILATSIGGGSGSGAQVHQMPDGRTMTGPMTGTGTHRMGDGSLMPDAEMGR
jgi:hypothetical protein